MLDVINKRSYFLKWLSGFKWDSNGCCHNTQFSRKRTTDNLFIILTLPVMSCSPLGDAGVSRPAAPTAGWISESAVCNFHFHKHDLTCSTEGLRLGVCEEELTHNAPADPVVPWRRWWGARSRPVALRRGRSLRWPGPGAAGRFSPPPRPAGTELWTEPCGPRCSPTWLQTWQTAPCSPTVLQRRRREKFRRSLPKRDGRGVS